MSPTSKCPLCQDYSTVFCTECSERFELCSCEENSWYCMGCDSAFSLGETGEVDEAIPDYGAPYRDPEDGPWFWPNGDEVKCECPTPKSVRCDACGVSREDLKFKGHWQPWIEDWKYGAKSAGKSNKTGTGQTYWSDFDTWQGVRCKHELEPVLLNTTTVYASGLSHKRDKNPPDFGLYAEWAWRPWWRNESIDWPDYSVPTNIEIAYQQICDAYEYAKKGLRVEVACMGGHGRTGTILACMAVLDGMTAVDAIPHLRKTYCSSIIETQDQVWFIQWFEAKFKNLPEPPMPQATKPHYCAMKAHTEMFKKGLTKCEDNALCEYFDIDLVLYNKDPQKFDREAKANA